MCAQRNHPPTVGFISAPAWLDPTPYEFLTVIDESVIIQQAFPLLPNFDYSLDSIASNTLAEQLCLCARSLRAAGCGLVVQVGSPFAWANVESEAQARQRNHRIEQAANVPSIMNSLAIVDALRAHRVTAISITSTYYSSAWNRSFSSFMDLCGFKVLHASNFYQQGLVQVRDENEHFKYDGCEMPDMVKASVEWVKNAAPNAEAIVIVGTGARTLDILYELEAMVQCPVIPADTVVYWLIAKYLNLTLLPKMGRFRYLPYQKLN
jgi:maleate cis-trans isomerase